MRDLADVLRAAGVPVVEEPGWRDRGTGGSFEARGIMLHHDASPAGQTSNGVDVIRDGRPGLSGPLSQLWLDFDGTWWVVAAGRANHAGEGSWPGVPTNNGNAYLIGIETDHTTNEHWTTGQRQYGLRGLYALCQWLGVLGSADDLYRGLMAHKEYAPTRKIDPDPLDMDDLRALILDPPTEAPVRTAQKNTSTTKVLEDDEWKTLLFTDDKNDPNGGQWCLAQGPGNWFAAVVEVTAEGPPGTEFYLRAYREAGDVDKHQYPLRGYVVPASGSARVELTQSGTIKDDAERLRVRGKTRTGTVTLTYTGGRIALW